MHARYIVHVASTCTTYPDCSRAFRSKRRAIRYAARLKRDGFLARVLPIQAQR